MRIAIDARSLLDGQRSGVEVYASNIIQAMLREAPHHEYRLFYNAARPERMPVFNGSATVSAFRYPNKLFNLSQWLWEYPRWDDMVAADCFFVPSLRLVPLAIETPLVTVVHDLSFERFPDLFSWRRRLWHRMMRPRELLRSSYHLIAVSHSTAEDIVELYGIARQHISVIYSGVDGGSSPPDQVLKEYAKRCYRLPKRFILYFGTLEPRKNVASIIRAFTAIAGSVPHDLVIAGPRGWLTQSIDKAAASSSVRARIHFIGAVKEADKMAIYSLADLFVYPSFYEGFGFPPLEALLSGTPVVTSYNSSLPEVVGDWATLINPYDPAELALAMKELLLRSVDVSLEVRQQVRERYSWKKSALSTLGVIERASQERVP